MVLLGTLENTPWPHCSFRDAPREGIVRDVSQMYSFVGGNPVIARLQKAAFCEN
jgi:hypothetical protein